MRGTIPIIRLELQGMTETIFLAFNEHQLQVSTELKAALERYIRPENLEVLVNNIVKTEIDKAIADEVSNYFRYGNGRKAIRDAVVKRLDEDGELYSRLK